MSDDLFQKCSDLVEELELGSADSLTTVKSLAGGVSSDIVLVEFGTSRLCIKFALPKLKVAADWHAPVHRNKAEYEWLQFAATVAPESAVQLYGRSEQLHGFAMDYLEGNDVYLWKTALLASEDIREEAIHVGDLVGKIHALSTKPSFNPAPFQNRDDFYSLRIEPYLVYTAGKHPSLEKPLSKLANNLYQSSHVLVHGDISPKNILIRDGTPIILDAECATMGDASFDLAFCLNHLVLKAIHLPDSRALLLGSVLQLWQSYEKHVDWEQTNELEARVCRLLPALMLARVDGKSPVEYLDTENQALVREIAIALVEAPRASLLDFTDTVRSKFST